jgi:hypothetical protein
VLLRRIDDLLKPEESHVVHQGKAAASGEYGPPSASGGVRSSGTNLLAETLAPVLGSAMISRL